MTEENVRTTDTAFTITRTFPAPLATVWDTWTRPEHFQQWFHAKPGTVELDLRTGGPWRAVTQTPGGEMPVSGVYREVIDGEKLVWTVDTPGDPVVMTATFSERDGRTVAVYHQTVVAPFTCDQAVAGATGLLDSFGQYLKTITGTQP
ncbi:SRPBCC domain-containing protein [Streptomyces silvisoli]|uniref:SRPBCC domain-containing protein n=1 Tax=Streptomyces silvisoli TaxID=3034235 RepID=A0ABT5ZJ10_9ACTN|nr:SRPBCC domain-containing protein [Streptomyces silvisoli]MDF3289641.1 SRPBCC domain-containing protein [Streptomyces silvisoli]